MDADTLAAIRASVGGPPAPVVDPAALRIEQVVVTLRLRQPVRLHFHHGGAIMGLLCGALQTHPLPSGLIPVACESGRVAFEAGDRYRLGVVLVGSACAERARVIDGLVRIGAATDGADESLPTLGGNFEVEGSSVPTPIDPAAWSLQLSGLKTVRLQFVSPFRQERPRELQVTRASHMNGACFPASHFLDRLFNRVFFLQNGRYPDRLERTRYRPAIPSETCTGSTALTWIDVPIRGRRVDPARPKGYTLGGVLGTVTLEGVPDAWIPWLVAGRLVHAGENTHYGFGRFLFPDLEAQDVFRPYQSARDRVADPWRLDRALAHVREHSQFPGVDGETPDGFAARGESAIRELAAELAEGRYAPQPLAGLVIPTDSGRVRPLAVPTVRDRVAQRAACDVLAPSIDTLLEDCAYAYRKGFSRQGAVLAIQRAYEEGYRYVLDADIESCFDAIEWAPLFAKIRALFPGEPLNDTLEAWVRAPVVFDGRRIVRTRGLPQGMPLSPLLANLYLDELDEELLGQDYRIVRFADDFVILCRDLASAEAARDAARAALSRLGLTLNEQKTAIRSFDAGFTYLGYLFCRSLALERKTPDEASAIEQPAVPEPVPRLSWLAQVPLERVRALAVPPHVSAEKRLEPVPLRGTHAAAPLRRPLYLTSTASRVRLRGEAVIVERAAGAPLECPIRALSHVVCLGRVRMTMALVLALARRAVPVYFCRRTGALECAVSSAEPDWTVWPAQGRMAADPQARLGFARAIVAAKLHNYAALIERCRFHDGEDAAADLRRLEAACADAGTLEELNGLEGRGAARYFACAATSTADIWRFDGRKRRPPTDPVNSMLSFGYTMLHAHLATAIVAAGLHPRIGLYHRQHGTHQALASDLQEEFRHQIDGLVWAMINRREVRPEDFVTSPTGACVMTPEFRRTFIMTVERRLQTEFTPEGGMKQSYREFMDAQARQLRDFLIGRRADYRPLRVRS